VFDQNSAQQEVFEDVKALILSCLDGFNISIFAYGQTGSRKTNTMEGIDGDTGVNQRAIHHLFEEIGCRRPSWSCVVSHLVVYQNVIRVLLSDTKEKRLKVKMVANGDNEVSGLTWLPVESVDDINKVSTIARQNRTTAMTEMNER
jgi:kinesin family member C2/C3